MAEEKKKEIFTHEMPWDIYAMSFSNRADHRFRLAVGSYIEDYANRVSIVQLQEETNKFVERASFEHPYPATKVMWIPDKTGKYPDLVATTGDYLRLWQVGSSGVQQTKLLNNVSPFRLFLIP